MMSCMIGLTKEKEEEGSNQAKITCNEVISSIQTKACIVIIIIIIITILITIIIRAPLYQNSWLPRS